MKKSFSCLNSLLFMAWLLLNAHTVDGQGISEKLVSKTDSGNNKPLESIIRLDSSVTTGTFPAMPYFKEKLDIFNQCNEQKLYLVFMPPGQRNLIDFSSSFRTQNDLKPSDVLVYFRGNLKLYIPDTASRVAHNDKDLFIGGASSAQQIYVDLGDMAKQNRDKLLYLTQRTELSIRLTCNEYVFLALETKSSGSFKTEDFMGEKWLSPILDGLTELCIRTLSGECLPINLVGFKGGYLEDAAGLLSLEQAQKLENKLTKLNKTIWRENFLVKISDGLIDLPAFTYYNEDEETTYTENGLHLHFTNNCQAILPTDPPLVEGSNLATLSNEQIIVFNKNMRAGRYYEAIDRYIDWQLSAYKRYVYKTFWALVATVLLGALAAFFLKIKDMDDRFASLTFLIALVPAVFGAIWVYSAGVGFWQVGYYVLAIFAIFLGPVAVVLARNSNKAKPVKG